MSSHRYRLAMAVAGLVAPFAVAETPEKAPAPRPWIDLTGYRTPETAITADPKLVKAAPAGPAKPAGYLGVILGEANGKPVVEAVEPDSPASAAGPRRAAQAATSKTTSAPPASARTRRGLDIRPRDAKNAACWFFSMTLFFHHHVAFSAEH